MATDFPTSIDTYVRPGSSDPMNSPSHAGEHDNAYDAIEAIETKVGTGSSTPTTTNKIIYGSGVGASTWATPDTAGIVDKTSEQTLTNKTLTSPTIQAWDCWMDANETWEYASATTITVPTNATLKYQKGDKIRLKQGGDYKYFYVVGVAATVLTVTGGDDYTVAEAAITDNYYSKSEN
ncbi:MAG: hypothetical protein PHW73_14755, partial [Atribacterota bacterium]|nr:hypothetical protein [Atribacterota bacterium]